jgi:hypothetical protein
MDESNFLDLLQVHGQMHETGAISVSTIDAEATIYLFEGEVVYAESDTDLGLAAVFVPMTWQQPRVTWIPGPHPSQSTLPSPLRLPHFSICPIGRCRRSNTGGHSQRIHLGSRLPEQSSADAGFKQLRHFF